MSLPLQGAWSQSVGTLLGPPEGEAVPVPGKPSPSSCQDPNSHGQIRGGAGLGCVRAGTDSRFPALAVAHHDLENTLNCSFIEPPSVVEQPSPSWSSRGSFSSFDTTDEGPVYCVPHEGEQRGTALPWVLWGQLQPHLLLRGEMREGRWHRAWRGLCAPRARPRVTLSVLSSRRERG